MDTGASDIDQLPGILHGLAKRGWIIRYPSLPKQAQTFQFAILKRRDFAHPVRVFR